MFSDDFHNAAKIATELQLSVGYLQDGYHFRFIHQTTHYSVSLRRLDTVDMVITWPESRSRYAKYSDGE